MVICDGCGEQFDTRDDLHKISGGYYLCQDCYDKNEQVTHEGM
jgi:formylmethanofuran dehydrogenase subunit E